MIARGDEPITPSAPVPRASRNMKTTGDESDRTQSELSMMHSKIADVCMTG